jgi:DDE superfamily endonuclease
MKKEKRRICLWIDNFSAHCAVAYQPTNIQVEFFEPNMTAFVQPCDAGIIKCFKALYRRSVCSRALDLDNAGERDIYKINLLEAMVLAKKAWNTVTAEMITHCWAHSQIEP